MKTNTTTKNNEADRFSYKTSGLTRKDEMRGKNERASGVDTLVNEHCERILNEADRFSCKPHRYLIIGPAWVGDMVMSQTLYILLKQIHPDCEIDVAAPKWTEPLLTRMPEVRRAIPLDIKHGEFALRKRYKIGKQLRTEKYSHAIVLANSFKSALIPYFAKIPHRAGWLGEFRVFLLNQIYTNPTQYKLMIERFMALGLAKNAEMVTNIRPQLCCNTETVKNTLTKLNLTKANQSILALCPGAEYGPAKRWPAKHFAKLADQMAGKNWQVWIFGSVNDVPIATEIMQHIQHQSACTNLVGKTNLAEAIDLLSVVDLVVCNDSGLMHIAAALDRPIIALYGSSSPDFTPPLSEQAKILNLKLPCSPCFERTCRFKHYDCLEKLSPEIVLQTIGETSP